MSFPDGQDHEECAEYTSTELRLEIDARNCVRNEALHSPDKSEFQEQTQVQRAYLHLLYGTEEIPQTKKHSTQQTVSSAAASA